MILYKGRLYDPHDQEMILERLEEDINQTRMAKILSAQTVISALERLGQRLNDGLYQEVITQLNIEGIDRYVGALTRENLEHKLRIELGEEVSGLKKPITPAGQKTLSARLMPLGTLLHIAAGNLDGLPALTVAEGLLTGNINLLKLPQADHGLSIKILMALIEIEPVLSDFICVFDTPSSDLPALKKMAALADGIVVWGGDQAVSAVRQFAPVGCKIIEWGHKLGFAYISGYEDRPAELAALAEHILSTRQLLCSSCQTIFIDTDNPKDLHAFCAEFLPYLEAAASQHPVQEVHSLAEQTLRRYHHKLEDILAGKTNREESRYQGTHCSLSISSDKKLERSEMFGNCIVKRLPRYELFAALRETKGYLQTAGLICSKKERDELADLLARSGVTRIMRAGDMSSTFHGEAHDGEYPLRRYTRIVNVQ